MGIAQGISRGISQGEDRKLVKLVCGKLRRGKTVEALEEEAVEKIRAAAALWGPSYDWEKVYETREKSYR